MRALRNCDFCAAEAVGTFEIVPPELDPTEAEQRRAVLCSDCKAQLSTLIEPLLAHAGADRTYTNEEANASEDVTDAPSSSTTSKPSRGDRTRDSDGPVPDAAAAASADGISLEHERTESTTDESPTDGSTRDESTSDGEAAENRASDSQTEANPAPPAYGKVVRLLRNRTFPMERRAVESLAAGAYDLESHEVEAIIEHALDEDEFAESDGELRRP